MQRLTPIEIQKQVFSKSFRGFSEGEVRAYLSLVAEEFEQLVQEIERLSRESAQMREQLLDHTERERILKDTLLSAQKVSEDVKANAHKEASLIVKDAELKYQQTLERAREEKLRLESELQELQRRKHHFLQDMKKMIQMHLEMVTYEGGSGEGKTAQGGGQ
jgi:cell division initiation protein